MTAQAAESPQDRRALGLAMREGIGGDDQGDDGTAGEPAPVR